MTSRTSAAGWSPATDGQATRVYRARNAEESPFRYTIHPQDQFKITMEIEDRGEEIAAIYHSHTKSPAEPSQTDINLAGELAGAPLPDLLARRRRLSRTCGHGRSATGRSRKSASMSTEEDEAPVLPLACPRCARKYPLDERFCADCGMPLVYVGRGEEQPITEAHERARKIKPQYTGGRQVGWRARPTSPRRS